VGFGNYLNTTGLALEAIMGDSSRHEEVGAAGFSSDYAVGVDADAPIMRLSVTARTASLANRTAARLVNVLATELRANQDAVGASPANQITMKVLTQPVAAKASGQQNRAMVAFGVAGFAAIAGVAVTVESWALARARKRGAGGRSDVDTLPFEHPVHAPATRPMSASRPQGNDDGPTTRDASAENMSDLLWKGVRWGARRSRASSGDR
jgi:hypothetical protein